MVGLELLQGLLETVLVRRRAGLLGEVGALVEMTTMEMLLANTTREVTLAGRMV